MFAAIILMVFSACFLGVPLGRNRPAEIVVPDDFSTIQEAINHANVGDTVFVKSGVYYENVVVNKTVSLVGEEAQATIVDANGTGRVVSISQGYVNITGFTIRKSGAAYAQDAGVWIEGPGHCNVFGNIFTENDFFGVYLSYTSFNRISNNTVTKTKIMSIVITTSRSNLVSRNTLEDHYCGVDIHALSIGNHITGNTIRRGDYGIIIDNSNGNDISYNNITDHKWEYGYNITGQKLGISVQDQSSDNTIMGNTIANNDGNGVQTINAGGNKFYHNNFINNSKQAYVSPSSSAITWDDGSPSGGNFWSDYTGADVDGDGLGDTPYSVDGVNTDGYPLIEPWQRLLGDINYDGTIDIYDAILLAFAHESTFGSRNWILAADLNEDNIVDIYDAILLASHFNQHYP